VVEFEGKGRGVVSTKPFQRGDFVIEYYGNLIDLSKAKKKEAEYSQNPDVGCYMYYFSFNNKRYW
jgi:histone-lysine N-methyltransferase SETD8